MKSQTSRNLCLLLGLVAIASAFATVCSAQDYDDENYSGQNGGNNNNNNNPSDNDSYNVGLGGGNDEGYNSNAPNYQQDVDSQGSNSNPNNYNPQGSAGSDSDGDYESDDNAAAASSVSPSVVRRVRRSVQTEGKSIKASASEPKLRVKRHGKYYIGPVYTYVKTDKHAHFKWGVKHKVGKKHHG